MWRGEAGAVWGESMPSRAQRGLFGPVCADDEETPGGQARSGQAGLGKASPGAVKDCDVMCCPLHSYRENSWDMSI